MTIFSVFVEMFGSKVSIAFHHDECVFNVYIYHCVVERALLLVFVVHHLDAVT